jgi:hypothetical protein
MTTIKKRDYSKQNPKIWKLRFRASQLLVIRLAQLCVKYNVQLSEMVRMAITEKYEREFTPSQYINNIDNNTNTNE